MTPIKIDDDIQRIIGLIGAKSMPVYVGFTPEPHARVSECFPSVAEKIAKDGGSQGLGWQLWKTAILVEGEFHAVWRSPAGELVDITPKQIPVERILFLPDPEAKYVGAQVDNIRLNITENRLVESSLKSRKQFFEWKTQAHERSSMS